MHEFTKKVSEKFPIILDFDPRMGDSEIIESATVIGFDGVADVSEDIITSNDVSHTSVIIKVQDGEQGKKYQINIKVATSHDNVFEDDIYMNVV